MKVGLILFNVILEQQIPRTHTHTQTRVGTLAPVDRARVKKCVGVYPPPKAANQGETLLCNPNGWTFHVQIKCMNVKYQESTASEPI